MTSDPCSGRRNLFQKFESICSELMPVTNSTIVWISLLKITALIEYHKANMNHGSMPKSDRLSIAKTCGAPGPAIPRKWLLKHQSDKKAFLGCRLGPNTSSMNWHYLPIRNHVSVQIKTGYWVTTREPFTNLGYQLNLPDSLMGSESPVRK